MDVECHPSLLSAQFLHLRCNTLSISYGMNRLGNILDVSIIQSGKANPTISGEKNGVFRSELIAHFT